jgi:hypothetical protein
MPRGCGTCSKPAARRCRSKRCTHGVHGPAGRRTVSAIRTTPGRLPPTKRHPFVSPDSPFAEAPMSSIMTKDRRKPNESVGWQPCRSALTTKPLTNSLATSSPTPGRCARTEGEPFSDTRNLTRVSEVETQPLVLRTWSPADAESWLPSSPSRKSGATRLGVVSPEPSPRASWTVSWNIGTRAASACGLPS